MTEQNSTNVPAFLERLPKSRRPRIALMGEFSAGKSTLANLIIGTDPLPMQVVATQLPPVWVSYGTDQTVVVDLQGNEEPCDLDRINKADPEGVAYIRFQCQEKILECCDIIDMPGISDPNMSSEVWARLMPAADGVIWCSPSTQAWRQSEAAVWDTVDRSIQKNSMLLLTRGDMLLTDRDKAKVLRRVRTEAEHDFAKVQMISLLEARKAVDQQELWTSSGAEEFVEGFLSLVDGIGRQLDKEYAPIGTRTSQTNSSETNAETAAEQGDAQEEADGKVIPRRPVARHSRLRASELDPEQPSTFTPKFS